MKTLFEHRFVLRQHMILMIGICLCVYFVYHAFQGERSYSSLMSLNANISMTQTELHTLQNERAALEKKVVMLRPGSINKDLLEERARAVLGFYHPDEIAVVTQ